MSKLKTIILYICDLSQANPSKLGTIKLNKILWYSDIFYYLQEGKSLTGSKYIKNNYGPMPENVNEVLIELENEGSVKRTSIDFHGYTQTQFNVIGEPSNHSLDGKTKDIIKDVAMSIMDGHTASSISELTHDGIWNMATYGEEIPLYTIFSRAQGNILKSDIEWAKREINTISTPASHYAWKKYRSSTTVTSINLSCTVLA